MTVPWSSSYRQGLHRSSLTASWPTSHPSRPLHSCAQALLSLPLPPTLTSASGIPRPSLTNSVILRRFLGFSETAIKDTGHAMSTCASPGPAASSTLPRRHCGLLPKPGPAPPFPPPPVGPWERWKSPSRARSIHCPAQAWVSTAAASAASPTCWSSWDTLQGPLGTSGQRRRSSQDRQ